VRENKLREAVLPDGKVNKAGNFGQFSEANKEIRHHASNPLPQPLKTSTLFPKHPPEFQLKI
jgi:hypothetical protein